MMDEPNYLNDKDEAACIEVVYDLQQSLAKTKQLLLKTHPVIAAATALTAFQLEMTETLIEAALHPKTDTERLHKIADAFNNLTDVIAVWQQTGETK